MISTILHVEDDLALRGLVSLAFDSFGFRGTVVPVGTVRSAIQCLEDREREGNSFDLIISDMHLPDGSGLDLVRYARATPHWRFVPVLILSGDVDPKKVNRAYALGANAYIDKSPAGRSLSDVLRSLYQHWAKDAVLPRTFEPNAIQQLVARGMDIRAHFAQLYQRIAESFPDDASESAFWLSRSLAEANLTNLLAFVQRTLADHDESDDVMHEIEAMQTSTARALSRAEAELEHGPITRLDAYRLVLDLLSELNVDALARSISYLFPVIPVAMASLRDFLIGSVQDTTAWIELHTDDRELHERAAQLRAETAVLSEQATPATAHPQSALQ